MRLPCDPAGALNTIGRGDCGALVGVWVIGAGAFGVGTLEFVPPLFARACVGKGTLPLREGFPSPAAGQRQERPARAMGSGGWSGAGTR
jgi:hypothetical protein